jgi:hypothetical protein
MSALPPKADIVERDRHVRFVPKRTYELPRNAPLTSQRRDWGEDV